jgi:hypothetical protein
LEERHLVKFRRGYLKIGDEYYIMGGTRYVKSDGFYYVTLRQIDRVTTDFKVPAMNAAYQELLQKQDLGIEDLVFRLEGPFSKEKGPFGRQFLEKYGTPNGASSRLPP